MNLAKFSPLPSAPGPLYRAQGNYANLYYAPGYLLRVDQDSVPTIERQILDPHTDSRSAGVDTLLAHSIQAQRDWSYLLERPYEPQSLHLYLNRRCQLACRYCYSDLPELMDFAEISIDAARAAAGLVAKNCADKNVPFVVVFHGGGEPILSWRLIDRLQPDLHRLAKTYEIPLFRYVATNGVMTEERARWLADSFELVGLSMDGPPEFQSYQRPLRRLGGDSTPGVLRTARILREHGIPVQIRVTLTAQGVSRQREICQYLCENFFPRSINVEPVYHGGRADWNMLVREGQLDDFVESFFNARAEAHRCGVGWQITGARPAEIHGPYCNIFRQVMQLVPGDMIAVCFKDTSADQARARRMAAGHFDGELNLEYERISTLRTALTRPKTCESCVLSHHCTFNCPNACLLHGEKTTDILCQLLKRIFSRTLQEKAEELGRMPGKIAGTILANA